MCWEDSGSGVWRAASAIERTLRVDRADCGVTCSKGSIGVTGSEVDDFCGVWNGEGECGVGEAAGSSS